MKKLLLPTDFSTCAGYATDAAIALAQKTGATLCLYHTLSPDVDPAKLQETQTNAQKSLDAIKNAHPGLNITTLTAVGALTANLSNYTNSHKVDLIIMGSQGASGGAFSYLGSNTQKVVRQVHCPVLVIKKPLSKVDFTKVAFASTFNRDDIPAFERFKDIVKHFIPEIHLIAIQTSGFFEAPAIVTLEAMEDFKKLAKPFNCEVHLKREGTVDHGIRQFAEDQGIQLIGISNVHRHPLKRIFYGSTVEALVNASDLPVLSIDYAKEGE